MSLVRVVILAGLAALGSIGCERSGAPQPSASASASAQVPGTASARASAAASAPVHHERVEIRDLAVSDQPSSVHVAWVVPKGTGVNDEAPFKLRWRSSDGLAEPPADVAAKGASVANGFDVALVPNRGTTFARLLGDVDLVVCDAETHSVCVPVKRELEMTFAVTPTSAPGSKPAKNGGKPANSAKDGGGIGDGGVPKLRVEVALPAAK